MSAPGSSGALWGGRVLSALPALALVASASMKLSHAPEFLAMWTGKLGYPEALATPIGVLELLVAILYVVPRTSVFGAILVTAYLGGAVSAHVRVGDGFVPPIVLGVMAWLGLWLRDPRLQALTPIDRPAPKDGAR